MNNIKELKAKIVRNLMEELVNNLISNSIVKNGGTNYYGHILNNFQFCDIFNIDSESEIKCREDWLFYNLDSNNNREFDIFYYKEKDIARFIEEIEQDFLVGLEMNSKNDGVQYICNRDMVKRLGISYSVAKKWRKQGIIPYSTIYGRVFYKVDDVNDLLESHSTKPVLQN